jgi:hypothetical protein
MNERKKEKKRKKKYMFGPAMLIKFSTFLNVLCMQGHLAAAIDSSIWSSGRKMAEQCLDSLTGLSQPAYYFSWSAMQWSSDV